MKKFLKNYYHILLPIGITVLMLLVCHLFYATVDDIYMMEIASSNAPGSENLVCMSVIYGYIFKALYTIMPAVNWFTIVYLAVLNVSMIVLFKLIKDNGSPIYAVGIASAIEAYLLIRITFTALSFISCTAAFMFIIQKVSKLSVKSIPYFIGAFFLYCMGFAMRGGAVYQCVLLLSLPVCFFAVIKKRNTLAVIVLIFVVCTAANYAVKGINKMYRATIADETYFNQFNEYRASITDVGDIDYDEDAEELSKVGITKNDVEMIRLFTYADKKVFNREAFKVIQESKSIEDRYDFNVIKLFSDMIRLPFVWWYLIAAILAFIILKKDRKEILCISLFVLGAITYLFVRQRGVARVVNQISISGIIMLMFVAMRALKGKYVFSEIKTHKLMAVSLACLFGLNIVVSWGYYLITAREISNKGTSVLEYINENPDNIYLCYAGVRSSFINRELTLDSKSIEHKPVYEINGNWFVYSGYWYYLLEELGLEEYKDCSFHAFLKPNVRYIAFSEKYTEQIEKFLDEHYGISAHFDLEKEFKDTNLKIYSLSKTDK